MSDFTVGVLMDSPEWSDILARARQEKGLGGGS